jgi:hypothetical protein
MNQTRAPATTVALFVWDYFDELINKLDIYTEESIEKFINKEKRYCDFGSKNKINKSKCDKTAYEDELKEYYKDDNYDEYEVRYAYEKAEELRNEILASLPAHPTQIEYFNGIRAESIRRIKQQRDEIIEKVKKSTSLAKCNPSRLTPQELEDLPARVFANSRFCFLIDFIPDEYSQYDVSSTRIIFRNKKIAARHFELITVFTDFYLSEYQVENIK